MILKVYPHRVKANVIFAFAFAPMGPQVIVKATSLSLSLGVGRPLQLYFIFVRFVRNEILTVQVKILNVAKA